MHTGVARRDIRRELSGEMPAPCTPVDGTGHICRHSVAVLDYIRFRGAARWRSGNDVWIGASQLYRRVRCVSTREVQRIPHAAALLNQTPVADPHALVVLICAPAFCVENLCDISLYGTHLRPLIHPVSRPEGRRVYTRPP